MDEDAINKKQQAALLIILLLLLTMIIGCGSSVSSENINLIKAGKYEEAATWLYDENSDLYNYCEAKISYEKGDYSLGKSYLDGIEDTYSGPLSEEVINYKNKMKEKNVEYGFQEIANKSYDKAAQWFYELSGFGLNTVYDENIFKLYNYAQSLQDYAEGDYSMAKLNAELTVDYVGYGEQEVKVYRDKIFNEITPEVIAKQKAAESAEKAKVEAEEKAKAKSEGVRIGMTQDQVRNSNWGNPKSINTTTTAYGIHEQWVYGGRNYLYFEDGILTSIQN